MQQINSVYACGVSGDEKKTNGPEKSGSGGCMVLLLLLLAFAVPMPVTAMTEAAEPAPKAARELATYYPESPLSASTNTNRSLEKCLSHCEDVIIKRLLSRVPSGRCQVHVTLHSMLRNDSIVAANISWGTVGKKELSWSPTLEPCPEDELTPGGLGSQCLVWWEVSSGGVTGHLVTESSSVQLSLWPETIYRVQRTNILVRSPILKLNTSTAAETVAAAATWQPPSESEFFDANEDGTWPYRNPNYTTKPEEPEEPEDKPTVPVPTNTKPELPLFVGLLIFLFVVLLSMAWAASSPDTDSYRDGTHPEHDSMMGNDEPAVEMQQV